MLEYNAYICEFRYVNNCLKLFSSRDFEVAIRSKINYKQCLANGRALFCSHSLQTPLQALHLATEAVLRAVSPAAVVKVVVVAHRAAAWSVRRSASVGSELGCSFSRCQYSSALGAHDAAAGTGPGDDVGKRVPRRQGLAAATAMKRQQTTRLDGRWQHVRSARRALEGLYCEVHAFETIKLDVWYTRYC